MKKALVVEANDGIRQLLIEVLTQEGYSVDSTSNGLNALARIREYIPSFVLLDSEMRGTGGIEVLTKISNSYPDLSYFDCAHRRTGRKSITRKRFSKILYIKTLLLN